MAFCVMMLNQISIWLSHAYRLYTKRRITGRRVFSASRIEALDFNTLKGAYTNIVPTGTWPDGATMWVADANGKIFSFNMPPFLGRHAERACRQSGGHHRFRRRSDILPCRGRQRCCAGHGDSNSQRFRRYDRHRGDTVSSEAGHTVSLSEGLNEITMIITAADGQTSETYTLKVGRGSNSPFGWKAAADFNGLIAAGNSFPIGIWSDGTTMWVVDAEDTKIYAYNLETKSLDSSKDFSTLDSAGNDYPIGIWSDGTTAWVSDRHDDKLYAYDLVAKNRVAAKDIDNVGSGNI